MSAKGRGARHEMKQEQPPMPRGAGSVLRLFLKPLALALVFAAIGSAQTADELDFLSRHTDFRDIKTAWSDKIKREAIALLEARKQKIRAIQSASGLEERKRYFRDRMIQSLGGLPQRTPLNARVTGTLEHSDYKVEKITFESQPGFHVTANLYLPKTGRAPYPAVLFPLGHETPGAKAYPVWQQILISLAKKGYVALAWDTLGQGERVQLYDDDVRGSKLIRSTTEHTMLGIQALLVGDALAKYTIWDGIRALDYLLTRPEVDSKRIGITGNSGGGTHTAYLAALDDRIHVAAASCYLTTWRDLLETIGPQDAEQCLPPSIADGLDHADFIYAFGGKPYVILSAIRDFFSINGARTTFEEAKGVYRALGAEDKIAMVEADDGHGYSKPRRLAAYRWFGKWLKGAEDSDPEPEAVIATEEELWATPTGQVATSLGGETVHSLNQKRAKSFQRPDKASLDEVRRLLAFEKPQGAVRTRSFGQLQREGYRIEKMVIESEPGVSLPALLYLPERGGRQGVLYVNGDGKAAAHADVEPLVKNGAVVLSVELRGMGETRPQDLRNGSDWPRYFGDFGSSMTAMLMGKTLLGMRVVDVMRAVDVLAARTDGIVAIGKDQGTIPLLHAAALDPRILKVGLQGMLVSFETAVRQRIHRNVFEHAVPGVLKVYDLPGLVAAIGPRPVRLVDGVDATGTLLSLGEFRAVYARAGNAQAVRRKQADTVATLYRDWF